APAVVRPPPGPPLGDRGGVGHVPARGWRATGARPGAPPPRRPAPQAVVVALPVAATRGAALMPLPSYAIVTPVKNEAGRLELTRRSVCEQTHRPAQWVIVDDGSTDGTRGLAESWAENEPWIRVIDAESATSERARGGRVVRAFERGRAALTE